LASLWASPASPAESPAEAAYVRAGRLALAGRVVEAQAALREVLRLDPAHPRAPERLRELYGQGLTAAQTIAALEAEVQANPTDSVSRNLLGVLYGRERRWDEALAVFRAALAAEPRAADAQANVGWVYLEVQRSPDALSAFEAALRLQPRLARAHAGYGAAVAEARGDFGAALASYRQALLLEHSQRLVVEFAGQQPLHRRPERSATQVAPVVGIRQHQVVRGITLRNRPIRGHPDWHHRHALGKPRQVGRLAFATDHGAGGPMWVIGNQVRGGLVGNLPSMTTPSNGNLRVDTDFRTVWQAIINEWLGGDAGQILPKGPFAGVTRQGAASQLLK